MRHAAALWSSRKPGVLKGPAGDNALVLRAAVSRTICDIDLQPDRFSFKLVKGSGIVCSGGASAWQDLALMMIAKRAGTEEAIRMSKLFLYQWHRDGQLPYSSMRQNVEPGDAAVLKCRTWLGQKCDHDDVVAELIRHSGLPRRTFARRFRAATGYSPLEYVQALRIEEAKQILETSGAAVEEVGREVGCDDVASFRRLFRRLAGMSPGEYRRKFQVPLIDDGADAGRARPAIRPAPARKRSSSLTTVKPAVLLLLLLVT